ncbi:MAG: RluA family pseudouridine synthase [Bacteroidales bacterium]|jgi:23S rRNA pseudouridine1911/1915/1917 synthase|nr:RluA family pseudouridine synthase [Bacteroidales bacterium]
MNEELEELQQQGDSELYEHHRIVVDKGQAMLRMDKYLQMRLEGVSRTKIQAAAKVGCILVNDKPAKSNYKVKPCDVISVLLPEPPHEFEVLPEPVPFDIVYEDDDVLVVDKKPGMVVHPGYGNFTGTLLNGLLYYFQDKRSKSGEPVVPYLVHRIDKDTSGLLLIAKNEEAQVSLAKQFFDHTIERKYNALVWGGFDDDSGTIIGNLERSPQDRRVMHVTDDPERGKYAVTHWEVLERFGYVTLIECVLETGRTHQIRAHMQHIGHPLFNDAAYGGDRILKGTTFSKYKQFVDNCFSLLPRQALHARILGFEHPSSGQHFHFESPLPADMTAVLEKWRNYAQNSAAIG